MRWMLGDGGTAWDGCSGTEVGGWWMVGLLEVGEAWGGIGGDEVDEVSLLGWR